MRLCIPQSDFDNKFNQHEKSNSVLKNMMFIKNLTINSKI